jgi:hypothetical protein
MTSMQPALVPKVRHNYLPLVIGFLFVLVAVGIGYLVVTRSITAPTSRNPLAVNPELKLVSLYEGVAVDRSLGENPELISFQHYTAVQADTAVRNFFAENPELTAVQRYAAWVTTEASPRNELAVNPELSWYLRYANK